MSSGDRVKKVRDIMGLTQEAFGERLGFKLTKIRDIEVGKQKLSPEIALDIEKKFYFSFRWLLTGEGEMKPGTGYTTETGSAPMMAEKKQTYEVLSDLEEMLLRIIKEGDETKLAAVRGVLAVYDPGKKARKAG